MTDHISVDVPTEDGIHTYTICDIGVEVLDANNKPVIYLNRSKEYIKPLVKYIQQLKNRK